jgi:hypothetical protein
MTGPTLLSLEQGNSTIQRCNDIRSSQAHGGNFTRSPLSLSRTKASLTNGLRHINTSSSYSAGLGRVHPVASDPRWSNQMSRSCPTGCLLTS